MYEPNKFFLKREDSPAHGVAQIHAMTHIPRVLTEADALTLAADLVKIAGGPAELEPYLVASYGGRDQFEQACKTGYEAKAEERKLLADRVRAQIDQALAEEKKKAAEERAAAEKAKAEAEAVTAKAAAEAKADADKK